MPQVRAAHDYVLSVILSGVTFFEQLVIADLRRMSESIVRWMDSGDVFSQELLDCFYRIARRFPEKTFYIYTKSLHLDWWSDKPPNFIVVQSRGGKHDHLLNPAYPEARIFLDHASRERAGFVDASQSDQPVIQGATKIGLILHGRFMDYDEDARKQIANMNRHLDRQAGVAEPVLAPATTDDSRTTREDASVYELQNVCAICRSLVPFSKTMLTVQHSPDGDLPSWTCFHCLYGDTQPPDPDVATPTLAELMEDFHRLDAEKWEPPRIAPATVPLSNPGSIRAKIDAFWEAHDFDMRIQRHWSKKLLQRAFWKYLDGETLTLEAVKDATARLSYDLLLRSRLPNGELARLRERIADEPKEERARAELQYLRDYFSEAAVLPTQRWAHYVTLILYFAYWCSAEAVKAHPSVLEGAVAA